jgi:hypothetical protein
MQLGERRLHGDDKRRVGVQRSVDVRRQAREFVGDQLCDDLAVCGADESHREIGQPFFDRAKVFDDAVVDQRNGAVRADVRVGVHVIGRPVRSPARVADADSAGSWLRLQKPRQVVDAPGRLGHVEPAAVGGDDSRAVVAAVLKPPQPAHEELRRGLRAKVSNNSTHGLILTGD